MSIANTRPSFDALLDRAVLSAGTIWILALFGAFAWAAWTGYFGIVAEAQPQLSTDTNWLPLAAEVARGNLLPTEPSLGTGASGLSFYPYLTIWIHGLFVALLGPALTAALAQTLWPGAAFVAMWLVYRLYLPRRWALTLSALGLIVFVPLPLRDFLLSVMRGESWRTAGVPVPPDSAGFPIPSFTLTSFLLAFLLSEQRRRLSNRRMTAVTILWALQTQIHIVNAAIGLCYWFSRFPQMLHRQRPNVRAIRIVGIVAIQGMLALFGTLPALAAWWRIIGAEAFLGQAHTVSPSVIGLYFYFAYFALPLALTALLYCVIRIDPYELVARFWPVYLLMAVEFLLVFLNLWFGIGVSAENIFTRLGVYFLHLFYYVPIIHYLTRANALPPSGAYLGGTESHWLAKRIRSAIQWSANEASKAYLPVLLVMLTAYAATSIRDVCALTREVTAPHMAYVREAVDILTEDARPGALLVADDPGVNLMLPVEGRFATLWVSRFANDMQGADIVVRLALYARLSGWSADDFVSFMAPELPASPAILTFRRGDIPRGVGYWLAYHRTVMDPAFRQTHDERMRAAFAAIEPARDSARLGVARVLSSRPLPSGLTAIETRETAVGRLYILKP